MTTLTANESKVIAYFATKGFTCWDSSAELPGAWSDGFSQQIAEACGISAVGARGVLTSLVKKKLFTSTWNDGDKAHWVSLTADGQALVTTLAEAVEPPTIEPQLVTVRTSHTDCTHEKSGAAGKKARAACRRERAKAATAE